MNVKPISKSSTNVSATPKSSVSKKDVECQIFEEYVELKQIPPPTPPPTPIPASLSTTDDEIRILQQALLSKRGTPSANTAIKHSFGGLTQTLSAATTAVTGSLNSVAQGTTTLTRIGNAINMHAITLRTLWKFVPTATSAVVTDWVAPTIRFVVWRSAVPVNVPAGITDFMEFTSLAPTSNIAPYTAAGATQPTGATLAVRNPYTYDRNHVYLDEVIKIPHNIWLSGTGTVVSGWHKRDFHINTHLAKTVFYGTTANLIVTNNLCFGAICEFGNGTPANTPANVAFSMNSDLTFNDADLT